MNAEWAGVLVAAVVMLMALSEYRDRRARREGKVDEILDRVAATCDRLTDAVVGLDKRLTVQEEITNERNMAAAQNAANGTRRRT